MGLRRIIACYANTFDITSMTILASKYEK